MCRGGGGGGGGGEGVRRGGCDDVRCGRGRCRQDRYIRKLTGWGDNKCRDESDHAYIIYIHTCFN